MAAIAFEIGKTYTLIGIDPFLGITTSRVIDIVRISNGMFVYVNNGEKLRGRHERTLVLGKELVFEGNDLPFMTDYEASVAGKTNEFMGDGLYNLYSEEPIEEIRKHIENYNLNQEINFGHIVFKSVPVFPELSELMELNFKDPENG